MNNEDAKNVLDKLLTMNDCHDCFYQYNCEYNITGKCVVMPSATLAIEALEKQIPRKPIPFICDSGDTPHKAYRCPTCGEEVLEGDGCSNNNCRQAIDWSNSNE